MAAFLGAHHDVLWLEIAVHYLLFVQVLQSEDGFGCIEVSVALDD